MRKFTGAFSIEASFVVLALVALGFTAYLGLSSIGTDLVQSVIENFSSPA